MTSSAKTALCLTGGGVTGGLYQIGALAALEDVIEGLSFDIYLGTSSGASIAAALAGGVSLRRLYRALLDPADNYFPLERNHIMSLDFDEWRRTIFSGMSSMRHGFASLVARTPAPAPNDLWEQLDRLYDALPAGLFTLDRYETFLSDFFLRRGVPNSFRALGKQLLIPANDLDAGELVMFGSPGLDHVPVSLACAASMALPLFFSPVRVGTRFYIDGGVGRINDIEAAAERGAELVVVVNPNVPIRAANASGVPTGHGSGSSLRDKGMMWVYNQAMRCGVQARLQEAIERVQSKRSIEVLLIEPESSETLRFLHNAASFSARREILEWSYRSTRELVRRWVADHKPVADSYGWHATASTDGASIPPPPPPANID
ncbi:MAG: patatin-like phospholipase family protein [Deltaproteobacteria bacterium]|nr:patatin-like phospholipase family protein [Deltaproteobacteria bacterium]